MELDVLMSSLYRERQLFDRRVGELQAMTAQVEKLRQQEAQLVTELEVLQEVSAFLGSFAEEAQQKAREQIELLVTHALRTIFDGDLSFRMVQKVERNNTTIDFEIVSSMGEQEVVTPVMSARGGGVASVVGFLLRLVVLLLSPNRRRVMVLDETFAQVSEEYEGRLSEFLRELVDKAGVQIIMVTHSYAFSDQADVSYRFRLEDGVTKVSAA